jgi:MazG family protein
MKSASKGSAKKAAGKPAADSSLLRKAWGGAVSKKKAAVATSRAAKATPASRRKGAEELTRLLELMAKLRHPTAGCPWDLEQTLDSLRPYLIEEAYEALDASESGNRAHLEEELGDVLLQIVFQSQVASEEGDFDFADVARGISDKLIRRHPHVFGRTKVADSAEVLRNWDEIKKTEKKARESVLDGVPKHIPPLHRAYQLQRRAAREGFDWDRLPEVYAKLDEEIAELKEAVEEGSRPHILDELGDVLFTIVNLARFVKCDPHYALERTNAKFARRFRVLEKEITASGHQLRDCTLAQMEEIWDRQRAEEKK